MLSYIAGVLAPVGVPTCAPTSLAGWTGALAAGQTARFAVTPIIEEHFTGQGEGQAMMFSFIHLHVSESLSASAPCPDSAQLVSAFNAAPATYRQSFKLSKVTSIRCWKNWVGAMPAPRTASSFGFDGFVFYSRTGGLHLLTDPAEWAQLKKQTCNSSSTSPSSWAVPVCDIQ